MSVTFTNFISNAPNESSITGEELIPAVIANTQTNQFTVAALEAYLGTSLSVQTTNVLYPNSQPLGNTSSALYYGNGLILADSVGSLYCANILYDSTNSAGYLGMVPTSNAGAMTWGLPCYRNGQLLTSSTYSLYDSAGNKVADVNGARYLPEQVFDGDNSAGTTNQILASNTSAVIWANWSDIWNDFGGIIDGTYTVGIGLTNNGTITITGGIITAIQEASGFGDGTVTDVAMTVPSILSVTPSSITSSGTFAITLATESANAFFAGPSSGSAATPTFRAILAADIPTLNQNTTGSSGSCTGNAATVTTNANLTGPITSVGNATSVAAQTGTGTTFVMSVSPTFTGTPVAPTATAGTNTTQIATTAFVQAAQVQSFPNESSHFTGPSSTTTSHTYTAGSNTLQQQLVGVMLIVSTLSGGTAIVTVNWVDAGSNNRSVTMTPVNYASTVNSTGNFPYPTITINPGSGTTITVTCTITGTIAYYFTSWSCNVS